MKRITLRTLFSIMLLAAVAFGAAHSYSAPARAAKAGVVTLAFTQEPDSLNPMYTVQYFSGLARNFFLDGAWVYDDKLNLVPRLAKEIPTIDNGGVSKDGTTITIKLRDDAKWSDGTAVTSDDFVFTAQMYADQKNSPTGRSPYDKLEVTAPDKTTVVAKFKDPYAPWPSTLFTSVLPAHILKPVFEKDGTIDKAEWNTNPTVGNGAFTLKEYQKGQFLLFARNDTYYGGKAKLDQVLIKIIPDDAAQVAAIKAGDSDVGIFLAASDADDLQKNAPVDVFTVPSGYNEGWFFNLNPEGGHPSLRDVKVRQALNAAIDREVLSRDLLNGLNKPAASFWDGTPYQDPSLTAPKFDKEAATKLLDDAGWKVGADGIREKDGVKLKLRYATNSRDVRKDAQLIIQKQLKDVGIDVELINYPNQQFLASYEKEGPIARGQFDVAQWSASPNYPDPNTNRFKSSQIGTKENNYAGSNWSHLNDPDLDKLFADQEKATDAAARVKIFNQISKLIADKVYWLPLWQDPDIWSVSKRVTGVRLSGASPFWNAAEWEAKE
jgi:peptide/nickel transport system substrate-binding protein